MADAVKALRALYDACHWVPSEQYVLTMDEQIALWDQAKEALAANEQNTGWRDIKTDPPLEGAKVLLLAGDFAFAGFVCDGEAVASGSPFGTTVWDASHWQPLPPPPGEEMSREIYAAMIEAFDRIAWEAARNQVIRELIEKADAQSACVISVWLKAQMEGE